MGQRSDGLLRDAGGTTIDWGAMLGVGLADVPKHYVSVYRECSLDELVRIVREGLCVPPVETRHPDMRAEMELLDRHRPKKLVEAGVSRLGAVYAVPTPETPRFPFRRERYVLELKVEPAEAFVGDMDFITCLIPFIGANQAGLDRYRGAFQKYWESVISLSDFLAHYRRVDTTDGTHWIAKVKAPKKLPRTFFAPEIMVMTPIISARHVRIMRREVTHDDGREYEYPVEPGMTWEDER